MVNFAFWWLLPFILSFNSLFKFFCLFIFLHVKIVDALPHEIIKIRFTFVKFLSTILRRIFIAMHFIKSYLFSSLNYVLYILFYIVYY